jgi:hypothetical protein
MSAALWIGACGVAALAVAQPATPRVVLRQTDAGVGMSLGNADPFYVTQRPVLNQRTVEVGGTPVVLVLWEEQLPEGGAVPFYGISFDGREVDYVRQTSYALKMLGGDVDPLVAVPSVRSPLAAGLNTNLYLVQFLTQPFDDTHAAIESRGGKVYNYFPNHAYIVRMDPAVRANVAALPFVRWVGPYHPAYRLEPFLLENMDRAEQVYPSQRYNILVFEPGNEQKNLVGTRITAIGGTVDAPDAGKHLLVATLTPGQLFQVASWDEVLFIDRWAPMQPHMNNARSDNGGGANYIETVAGYRGAGGPSGTYVSDVARVRGEVFDNGFNLVHHDFTTRPLIEHGGSVSIIGGHGASTSGIIFGAGMLDPTARGVLPSGQGIVADHDNVGLSGQSRYDHTCELVKSACCPTNPPDPTCQEDPNAPYQAVFQSTSAGAPYITYYSTVSYDVDDILFDFDIVHCQSQANNGTQSSAAQAWAKNTISVGGVNHFDNLQPADDAWFDGMHTPASTGPAADGRVKPDLTHFYDAIRTITCCDPSTATSCGNCSNVNCCDPYSYTSGFVGTSGATPIVCGYAGLVMEMWADRQANGKNIFGVGSAVCNPGVENCVFKRRPHMTTVKALLINTAKQYDWIAAAVNHDPNEDLDRYKQGWGLPDVKRLYDFRAKMLIVNETNVLRLTGRPSNPMGQYKVSVAAGEPALRATMTYADPPGNPCYSPCTAPARVNDLNLKVISPSGTIYWGNVGLTAGLWSTPGGSPDAFDTVENVFVSNPPPGDWSIQVWAFAINQDARVETPLVLDADFALVVSGGTPFGACCIVDQCLYTLESSCLAQGGVFHAHTICPLPLLSCPSPPPG